MAYRIPFRVWQQPLVTEVCDFLLVIWQAKICILNDNSGRGLVGPAETIENDAVFDHFGAVFDRRNSEQQ